VVLIAGGGIAGLEALMAIRDLAGDRARITLVAPDPEFVYKPLIVEEPFSFQPAEEHALAPVAEEFDAELVQAALAAVDPAAHSVTLGDGSTLDYDRLVVCVGARARPAFEEAVTMRVDGAPLAIESLLRDAEGSEAKRIAFVIPPGKTWPLPVYELALMGRRKARELGLTVECCVVTPEEGPLIAFGRGPSEAVRELLEARGIVLHAAVRAKSLHEGVLTLAPGDRPLAVGRVVSLPLLEGPRIPGLPADDEGFIPIDGHGRVREVQDVFAAGDGANFPIKHGGLGSQQADAAAEQIAAELGAELEPQPFVPVIRGKLLTGDESIHLQHTAAGGGGEGQVSADHLWWPPQKISGRYLSPWLGHTALHGELPAERSLEVEVALPKEWHEEPMAIDPYKPLA